jgi:hypothetical protein
VARIHQRFTSTIDLWFVVALLVWIASAPRGTESGIAASGIMAATPRALHL